MIRTAVGLLALTAATSQQAELLNSDFENLKSRLVGPTSREGYSESLREQAAPTSTWRFRENGQSYEATFEAVSHGHALLERNSGFIAVRTPLR